MKLLLFIALIIPFAGSAQKKIKVKEKKKGKMVVYEGDTVAYDILPAVPVGEAGEDFWKRYNQAKFFIPKVYYYAILAKELLNKYDTDLADLSSKKEKKKYLKKANKELKQELGDDISKMSEIRGFYLVKMIHREMDKRAYDIIAEYRGKGTARMWQGISRLGGANLKLTYDAQDEDGYMELVIREIEDGTLAYEDHTPKTDTGKKVMKDRKKRKKKKAKKLATK